MNVKSSKWFSNLEKLAAHEVCRPHFRLRNPFVSGVGNFLVQPIYDYYGVAVATATTRQTLFSIPRGQPYTPAGGAAFTKTELHTNLKVAGQLENPWRMLIRNVGVFLDTSTNTLDAEQFASQVLLTLEFSGVSLFQSIVGRCPAGGGTWIGAASTGTAGAPVGIWATQNGTPAGADGYSLCAPGAPGYPQIEGLELPQGQQFDVIVDPTLAAHVAAVGFTTAAAAVGGSGMTGVGIRAWVVLDGTLMKGAI